MNIPLPLKIITVVIIVLVILLIIIIRKRKKQLIWPVIFLIFLAIGFGVWKGLKEYNRTNDDLSTVKPDINIPAVDLIREYETNDSVANSKYLGKIIETNGAVKEVEKDDAGYFTIILADGAGLSSVRCSIDTLHQKDAANIPVGSSVIVRGKNNGYNKLVGSDVYLNYCVVIQRKN